MSLECDKHCGKAGLMMNWSQENCLYGQASFDLRVTGRGLGTLQPASPAALWALSSRQQHKGKGKTRRTGRTGGRCVKYSPKRNGSCRHGRKAAKAVHNAVQVFYLKASVGENPAEKVIRRGCVFCCLFVLTRRNDSARSGCDKEFIQGGEAFSWQAGKKPQRSNGC